MQSAKIAWCRPGLIKPTRFANWLWFSLLPHSEQRAHHKKFLKHSDMERSKFQNNLSCWPYRLSSYCNLCLPRMYSCALRFKLHRQREYWIPILEHSNLWDETVAVKIPNFQSHAIIIIEVSSLVIDGLGVGWSQTEFWHSMEVSGKQQPPGSSILNELVSVLLNE